MASLAQTFIQGAMQQNEAARDPNAGSGFAQGAQIALEAEKLQQQRAQMEAAKQKLEQDKLDKIGAAFNTWSSMPEGPGKKIYGEKFIPNLITAVGYQDKIHPLNLEIMMKDDQYAAGILAGIRSGRYTPQQLQDADFVATHAQEIVKGGSAEQISGYVANNPKAVTEAFHQRQDDAQSEKNAHITGQYAAIRQATDIEATGPKEIAKKANDLYVAYEGSGGRSSQQATLDRIDEAISKLESGEIKTGNTLKKALTLVPDIVGGEKIRNLSDSNLKTMNEKILQSINMKAALADPNPADNRVKEVERRMSVDMSLDKDQNIAKLKAARQKHIEDYDNTENLFRKYVRGYGAQDKTSAPKAPQDRDAAAAQRISAMPADKLEAFIKANPKNKYVPLARKQLLKLSTKK